MRAQLKKVVNEGYWKRAEAYLDHFLKEKALAGSQSAMSLAAGGPSGGGGAPMSTVPLSGTIGTASIATGSASSNAAAQEAMKRRQAVVLQQQQQQQSRQQGSVPPDAASGDLTKKRPQSAAVPSSAGQARGASGTAAVTAASVKGGKAAVAAKNRPKAAAASAMTTTPTGQQQQQCKSSLSSVGGNEASTLMPPPQAREYNELMELVDHAADFDWTVAGSFLGEETQWLISEEQKKLVYDSKTTVNAAAFAADPVLDDVPAFPVQGWSERNLISTRVAWARVRLGKKTMTAKTNPVVANGLLSLQPSLGPNSVTMEDIPEPPGSEDVDNSWYNEEKAEKDKILAVLSEGTQIYIKSVLEKALFCARQRQNLDGIRLWHQQFVSNEAEQPSLALRLGCDVNRQIAQSSGNAAMTCKRMEEALERQSDVPERFRTVCDETLLCANSMSDLALRPLLSKAIVDADMEAKRNFDVYKGKDANEPPFGRVPKMAKIEVIDFQTGMMFATQSRQRHQASTLSSSFFY